MRERNRKKRKKEIVKEIMKEIMKERKKERKKERGRESHPCFAAVVAPLELPVAHGIASVVVAAVSHLGVKWCDDDAVRVEWPVGAC
jgi:hypothetical protein